MRISGITIPDNKRLEVGLTAIYGIGFSVSNLVLKQAGIDPNSKPKDLSTDDENKIRKAIEDFGLKTEGDLKREVSGNVARLKSIGTYRGTRHAKNLPARGQRTKSNSRTVKGNKRGKTIANKKKPAK
jgi:small subunit ribosomal protein S13